jgi:hypothetical protein
VALCVDGSWESGCGKDESDRDRNTGLQHGTPPVSPSTRFIWLSFNMGQWRNTKKEGRPDRRRMWKIDGGICRRRICKIWKGEFVAVSHRLAVGHLVIEITN